MDLVWHPRVMSMLYKKHRWICLCLSTKSDFIRWHSYKLSGFHWLRLNQDWCRQLGNKQKQTDSYRIFSSELKSCSLSEGVTLCTQGTGDLGFYRMEKGDLGGGYCRSVPRSLRVVDTSRFSMWISLSEASTGAVSQASVPVQSFSVHLGLWGH